MSKIHNVLLILALASALVVPISAMRRAAHALPKFVKKHGQLQSPRDTLGRYLRSEELGKNLLRGCRRLLQAGADPNGRYEGKTALMFLNIYPIPGHLVGSNVYMFRYNGLPHPVYIDVAKLLEKSGADLNAQDTFGSKNTALMQAVELNNLLYVRWLAARPSIRLDVKNKDGKTAYDVALEQFDQPGPSDVPEDLGFLKFLKPR